jgi:hypothetical protein
MMRKKRQPFSDDDVDRMRSLARNGADAVAIADALGRSADAVRYAAHYRGIPLAPMTNGWSDADYNTLTDMQSVGFSAPTIAAKLRRTAAAVTNMVLGLSTRRPAGVRCWFSIAATIHTRLCTVAREHGVGVGALMRIIIERTEKLGLIEGLLDGDEEHTDAAIEAEQQEERRLHPCGAAVTPPTIVMAPVLMGQPTRPMLMARLH